MRILKSILVLAIINLLTISAVFSRDIKFAQVTDVRFSPDNKQILESVINEINKQQKVEFVVFTGDNIEAPSKENLLAFLKTAKHLKVPFYIVLGDKDVNKRKDLSKKQYAELVHKKAKKYNPKTPNYVFERQGVVFMVLDGTKDVIPSTTGYYKDDVLEWMDANLDLYSNKNVIILQHFPIIPPIERDSYYTFKADKYMEVVKKHENVKAIIAGHFGVNKEIEQDGVKHISTAPAPNYRIIDILDCNTKTPAIWVQTKQAQ